MTRSRLSKLPLVAALVAVVLILRHVGRRRRLLAGLATILFAYPGEDQVDGVLGFFGGIGSDIKDFVTKAIAAAVDKIWELLNWLKSQVDRLISLTDAIFSTILSTVAGPLQSLFGFLYGLILSIRAAAAAALDAVNSALSSLINQVYQALLASLDFLRNLLLEAIAAARDFAVAVAAGVRDLLIAVVYQVRDTLVGLVAAARDFAVAVAAGVRDLLIGIVSGVRDALGASIGFVRDLLVGLVQGAVNLARSLTGDLWDFVYKHLLGPLEDLGQFVWHEVQDAVDLIHAALDWLVWMGEVAFSDVADLITGARDIGPRDVLDGIADATGRVKGGMFARLDPSGRRRP